MRKRQHSLGFLLATIFLLVGCEHFHAKTFLTTSPLYYTDLIGSNHEKWEQITWDETERVLLAEFPQEIFRDLCAADLHRMLPPRTIPYHAFNIGQLKGMTNGSHQVVLYPLGQIDVLFHEYIHARNSQWSEKCLSEMLAILLTRSWASENSVNVRKLADQTLPR